MQITNWINIVAGKQILFGFAFWTVSYIAIISLSNLHLTSGRFELRRIAISLHICRVYARLADILEYISDIV